MTRNETRRRISLVVLAVWVFQVLVPVTGHADAPKNYAVVWAGPDRDASTAQEAGFALKAGLTALGLKDKGYDTSFLFSYAGTPTEARIKPGSRAAQQYEFLRRNKLLPPKGDPKAKESAGTSANLEASLEKIIKEAPAGAKVEVVLLGHGASCGCSSGTTYYFDKETSSVHDAKPGICTHRIGTGGPGDEKFETEKLAGYLKRMEDKGLKPNVVVESCHSGALLRALTGLKETCAYMLSTGNSPGVGCGETDEKEWKDYTSTVEAMFARYYAHMADKLKDDPYLNSVQKNDCYKRILARYKGKDLSTMEKAFWTGRSLDESPNEPRLSPLHDVPYFSTGQFNRPLMNAERRSFDIKGKGALGYTVTGELKAHLDVAREPGRAVASRALDETRIIQNVQQMIKLAKLEKDEKIIALRKALAEAMAAYNTSVTKQQMALEDENWNDLATAQKDTEELAAAVTKAERALVDDIRTKYFETDQAAKDNPKIAACRRTL